MIKIKTSSIIIVIFSITLFYIVAFRGVIFQSGHVYQSWDIGIPPFSAQLQNLSKFSISTWWSSQDMGTPGAWTGMTRYFDVIVLNGLSFLGGKFLSKWLYLVYALIGGLGFWKICRELNWGLFVTLIVVLISQFNPKTYSLTISGHLLQQGFAYSLTPWLFFIIYKAFRSVSIREFVINILLASIIGSFIFSSSPISVANFIVFLILFSIAFGLNKKWQRILTVLIVFFTIVIILHLFWLIPVYGISKETIASFKYAFTAEDIMKQYINVYHNCSSNIKNAIIGHINVNDMSSEYVYPVISKFADVWRIAAYSLLLLAVLGAFLKRGWREWKLFSILCMGFGIILFAGDKTFMGRFFYEAVLIKLKICFFLMSRTSRWLLVYYFGFAMMLGFALDSLSSYKGKLRSLSLYKVGLVFLIIILLIYWFPYLFGSLTKSKNDTSQTLSLMPQEVSDEEAKVVEQFSKDEDDYRITVLPTVAGPTGDVPRPPKSTYTRNFLLFGKDTIVGPQFVGEVYSRFLLNLIHRECPYTDQAGKLFGLGAVKRLLQVRDEKYYSYFNFGYMLRPNNCHETLHDPGDVLERFVSAQKDLIRENDSAWKFKQVNIYKNEDFLPRIRMVENAYLASGGMSLFVSMAETQVNFFRQNAVFFDTDMDESSLDKLKQYWKGVIIYNNSWPELLMPFLSKDYWHSANAKNNDTSTGWVSLKDSWDSELWFNESVIDNGALLSIQKTEIAFRLKGKGAHRLFVCYGRSPYAGKINFYINGKNTGSVMEIENNRRGFIWKDFGNIEMVDDDNIFKAEVDNKGVVIRGLLLVPTDVFDGIMSRFEEKYMNGKNISIIAEAEAVSERGCIVKSNKEIIPFMNDVKNRVKATMFSVKNVAFDIEENRIIIAEGDKVGEVIFEISFNENISKYKLECYPELFNDVDGSNYISAYASNDGVNYNLIFKRMSNKSGKWDDVYTWRQEDIVNCTGKKIYIKFELKFARLSSLVNAANTPMRIVGDVQDVCNAVKSWGQAVSLPASFTIYMPRQGEYNITARIIGRKNDKIDVNVLGKIRAFEIRQDGAEWLDIGRVRVDVPGTLNIKMLGSKDVCCDLFDIESALAEGSDNEDVKLQYNRINPAEYNININRKAPGLLLFSESFHSKWYFKMNDKIQEPVRVFGFMNAYLIDKTRDAYGMLYFKYQPIREYWWKICMIMWVTLIVLIAIYYLGIAFNKFKKIYEK